MPLLASYRGLGRAIANEIGLLPGRPRLWAACLVVMGIPALYATTYLAGVWNPYGHLNRLPVGLVDEDRGARAAGHALNLGHQVVTELDHKRPFAFRSFGDETQAHDAVARGEIYFALVIPPEFSARAVAAGQPAQLRLLSSEGTSYMASLVGERFVDTVASTLNDQLGAARWKLVLGQLGPLREGVGQLREGAHRLQAGSVLLANGSARLETGLQAAADGTHRIHDGAGLLADGVGRLTAGAAQLDAGLRTMNARMPQEADLDRLSAGAHAVAAGNRRLADGLGRLDDGANSLANGQSQLASGLDQLAAGTHKLAAGSARLTDGMGHVPLAGAMLALGPRQLQAGAERVAQGTVQADQGAQRLASGADTLANGAHEARVGAERLASGAHQLDDGVQRLTGGMKTLHGALRTIVPRLPADRDLTRLHEGAVTLASGTGTLEDGVDRLAAGSQQLASGAGALTRGETRLAGGLDTLYAKLPSGGTAAGYAAPVSTEVVKIAPVRNNGVAFAPYFIALALWMGAVMTGFVFHFTVLPESSRDTGQRARMLAKAAIPTAIVIGQALVLGLVMQFGLHVPVPHPVSFYAILLAAAWTYLNIVMGLVMLVGDAGKLAAIVLLVFQLAAAGGPFPIELAPVFYQRVNPYLPIAQIVKALRADLFGAYGGHWGPFTLEMLLVGLAATLLALALGRRQWRFVPDEAYGPIIQA
ncbi:MAG TPA: YhgE/Pip domain-containing protein [Oscillatoriaceae cyanobacterium]